ncbi:MAG TPA: bifunctional 3-hydroxydecanoyl-ACP dehydratase/trans-2-decenoyl-ACP isomerase [Candidatus Eisenbacteria bacterium]|nr:bifunctional 3-hydroxydecanoyl-ACP dehydratase/trans-2-decenoyl-ACP isomerase [Candidatus Eisenbacteria bacterium]
MTHAEFRSRRSFALPELLAFAHGRLIDDPPAGFATRLPLPPMLMVDRIVDVRQDGARGTIVGERDVRPDDWFFACHFAGDPVQPGCLGVDAVWQLIGFFCAWRGGLGAGRALGCGEIAFDGQIRPHDRTVRYAVDVRRCAAVADGTATLAIGDATVSVDDTPIYTLRGARVGLFRNLADAERSAARTNGSAA